MLGTTAKLIISPLPFCNIGGFTERTRILMGLVLGIVLGLLVGESIATLLAIPGDIFIGLLKMVVVPLVLVSVMFGIAGNKDISMVRKVGASVFIYFLITTCISTTLGSSLTIFFAPGEHLSASQFEEEIATAYVPTVEASEKPIPQEIRNTIKHQIPKNILGEMVASNMLQVVLAAALLGAALLSLSQQDNPYSKTTTSAINYIELTQEMLITIVHWAMKLAPMGVLGIMTHVTATSGVSILFSLSGYIAVLLFSLFLMLCIYALIIQFIVRKSVKNFFMNITKLQLMAFSTSSSAAVMPLSIETAEAQGVNKHIARFIVPLGTTINMDGTAMYQAVAAVFLMQIFGVPVSIETVATIVGTAILASIGTPGTPGMGLVVLSGILAANGVPEAAVGIIFGVDRPLDMCRTAVNVTGDQCAAQVMQKFSNKS